MKLKKRAQNVIKKILFFIYIFFSSFYIQAQPNKDIIYINDTSSSLATVFFNYYQAHESIDSACLVTNTLIKLSLDNNYKIKHYVYNFQTDEKVKEFLDPFIKSLGKWIILDKALSKRIRNKDIILPIILNLFNSSCKSRTSNKFSLTEMLNFDTIAYKEPYPYFMGSNNLQFFDGIILKPLILFSPYK